MPLSSTYLKGATKKDPTISEVLKKQSAFFKHINNSIANRPAGRTEETAKAIELLAEMKTSVSKLGPEHEALKQQLTKDMADFENLLLNFANVAHLAESRMGQTVNSADNQLAPYFVKTLYRYSVDVRRSLRRDPLVPRISHRRLRCVFDRRPGCGAVQLSDGIFFATSRTTAAVSS